MTGDVVVVVVVATVVDVLVVTLAGDVEEGGGDEAAGASGVLADVSVKTSTIKRIGLDHITRWALLRENGPRAIVLEG